MADEYTATLRIRRPAKVRTDERGRTVWVDTIETAELELVSTEQLKQLLESADENARSTIRQMVENEREGVLARNPATGLFEIISDDDLRAALGNEDAPKTARRPADVTLEPLSNCGSKEELSLVSTQMLRKVLQNDTGPAQPTPSAGKTSVTKKDEGGGFDPYNTG
jgi:hypothetical protein